MFILLGSGVSVCVCVCACVRAREPSLNYEVNIYNLASASVAKELGHTKSAALFIFCLWNSNKMLAPNPEPVTIAMEITN